MSGRTPAGPADRRCAANDVSARERTIGPALLIYESMYGNTEAVAEAIGRGIGEHGNVEVLEVGGAPAGLPAGLALLVVGGPTHAFGMSRPSTRADAARQAGRAVISAELGVREWLEALRVGAHPPAVAVFDTHVDHPRLLRHVGSAAGAIERRLARLGLEVLVPAEHFWVHATQGPLVDGESRRAELWGRSIASHLERARPPLPR